MIKNTLPNKIIALASFILIYIASTVYCATNLNSINFQINNIGKFNISLINAYKAELINSSNVSRDPVVKIKHESGEAAILYKLTSLRDIEKIDYSQVKTLVFEDGNIFLKNSIETKLNIFSISINGNTGYYYKLTDKRKATNENFKYILRGGIIIDKTYITFSILTNKNKELHFKDGLEMLKTINIE